MNELLEVREEVRRALRAGRPVLALESSIIAHGMPRPQNVETALEAEAAVRRLGVVPATIGVLGGQIRVGLRPEEIEELGTRPEVLKVSRRDLAFALARRLPGGTTVSATMLAAQLCQIEVFATGGIGGVHRGAASTFDVSADLRELARTPVTVVAAGAKAILDLPKTLEVLESLGVPVIGYRTRTFPAFFSVSSGLPLELTADSPLEVARIHRRQRTLGLPQGLLVANPIPAEAEVPSREIQDWLEQALAELRERGIEGKEVTPFLLGRIVELSGGRSLRANVALVLSNVELGARIAAALASQALEGEFSIV